MDMSNHLPIVVIAIAYSVDCFLLSTGLVLPLLFVYTYTYIRLIVSMYVVLLMLMAVCPTIRDVVVVDDVDDDVVVVVVVGMLSTTKGTEYSFWCCMIHLCFHSLILCCESCFL